MRRKQDNNYLIGGQTIKKLKKILAEEEKNHDERHVDGDSDYSMTGSQKRVANITVKKRQQQDKKEHEYFMVLYENWVYYDMLCGLLAFSGLFITFLSYEYQVAQRVKTENAKIIQAVSNGVGDKFVENG